MHLRRKDDDWMEWEIIGTIVPAVACSLENEESMYTQTGSMMMYSGDINYNTNLKGGIKGIISRKMTGESAFVTNYSAGRMGGNVTFATTVPGTIKCLYITPDKSIICQKTAFLCAEQNVDLSVVFTKRLRAGLLGGEGFILQKLSGEGNAFLEIAGDVLSYELQQGDILRVNPGNIVAFADTVDFDIEFIKDLSTIAFDKKGMFISTLKGPGLVVLQTQNRKQLSSSIINDNSEQ